MKRKLLERLDRYCSGLEIARKSYRRTGHSSWANRINELEGRCDELRYVIGLLNRQESLNR